MRSAVGACVALIGAAIVLPTHSASAQTTDIDTNLWIPTASPGATFTIARPQLLKHAGLSLGLGTSLAGRTFVRDGSDDVVVPWQSQTEFLAAIGLFEYLELGVALPVSVTRAASDPTASPVNPETHIGLGDPRVSIKVPLLRGDVALSARLLATVPGGASPRQFRGSDYWTAFPSLLFSWRIAQFTLATELGYRFREQERLPGFELDDELEWKLGGHYAISEKFGVIAEGMIRVGLGGSELRSNEVPAELSAGIRTLLGRGLVFEVGASAGVLDGYGAPLGRGFATLRWLSEPELCPFGPEDYDGYRDGDFCRDPDNDNDGIEDSVDACPNDAEDMDGYMDDDGCPDLDDDADAIPDPEDKCPNETEDRDGYRDADGCPDPDNDEDGVPDTLDRCPMDPEDLDRYQDDDGCPEPGPDRATVTVSDSRILISERIYFDFDRDTIRSVSKPLLDQVAYVIRKLPRRKLVRVEGYTDNAGPEEYNRDLSYRRAKAVVEYLAQRGVRRRRLTYVGYGSKKPVAPNDSPEGKALNRRVEFTIYDP